MSTRLKLFVVSLLLCVALASAIFTAVSTVQAYQHLTQNHQRLAIGDTSTVSPWMTIPYIAHVYHVPESCLFQSLHISTLTLKTYASLRFIADASHRSIDAVMFDVRHTILEYRQHHLVCPTPVPVIQLLSTSRHPPMRNREGK